MTEDEAKTKTCCGPDGTGYANDQPFAARWCLASQCMAWRLTETSVTVDGVGKIVPDQTAWGPGYRQKNIPNGGYCGLAGAPA